MAIFISLRGGFAQSTGTPFVSTDRSENLIKSRFCRSLFPQEFRAAAGAFDAVVGFAVVFVAGDFLRFFEFGFRFPPFTAFQ